MAVNNCTERICSVHGRKLSSSSRLTTTRHWIRLPRFRLFPKSKAAILILLWNSLVGFAFTATTLSPLVFSLHSDTLYSPSFPSWVQYWLCVYGGIGLLQLLFYPIGGVLADLRFGRYRTVLCSTFSLWLTVFMLAVITIIYSVNSKLAYGRHPLVGIVVGIIPMCSSVLGFTGFQANSVQFGLDQLLDAPSEELSVFLHWFVWMDQVGTFLAQISGTGVICMHRITMNIFVASATFVILAVATGFILPSCFKRSWFHNEPRTHNPYGTVYKVLKYVVQHDKPERRSAMTYADDERPTRMEYPKERFGGPFSTETVEDVKTFLRILLMLVVIGPMFSLQLANVYIFPLFGMHVAGNHAVFNRSCDTRLLLYESTAVSNLTSIVVLPLYIVFLHRWIPRYCPRFVYRLGFGIALMVIASACIMVLDITGHAHLLRQDPSANISCMFTTDYRSEVVSLDFYKRLLIIPNILTGLAVPLILITTLEFISAQSPHTMKGLLLGVFYAVRGFFIMLGCAIIVPFTSDTFWISHVNEVTNCGFYYYLVSTLFGIVGAILFFLASRWYQNRERQDEPYGPKYVDDYYSKVFERERSMLTSQDQSLTRYGTA